LLTPETSEKGSTIIDYKYYEMVLVETQTPMFKFSDFMNTSLKCDIWYKSM